MENQQIKQKVEQKISILIDEFRATPDKFLTEEDVRAYLYHLLLADFNDLKQTEDGKQSIPIHCEVRWYGQSRNLKYRSDIVIIDISTLRVSDENFKLPSKGYGFNKPLVIIEIKLRRKIGDSDNVFLTKIRLDCDKLTELRSEIDGDFESYLIIFDKKNNLNLELKNTEKPKEYYAYPYIQENSI